MSGRGTLPTSRGTGKSLREKRRKKRRKKKEKVEEKSGDEIKEIRGVY